MVPISLLSAEPLADKLERTIIGRALRDAFRNRSQPPRDLGFLYWSNRRGFRTGCPFAHGTNPYVPLYGHRQRSIAKLRFSGHNSHEQSMVIQWLFVNKFNALNLFFSMLLF